MEVWKDIFRPGQYRDQSGALQRFTKKDVLDAKANIDRMLSHCEAWAPPAIHEHDWTSCPVPISQLLSVYETDRNRRADTTRNTFGHVKKAEIRMENGKPVLWACHEIPDPADADAWKRARYCSPRVDWDVTDPLGRKYPGACIIHVAATTRPIQVDQKPVMLSAWGAGTRSLLLSRDPMADGKDDTDDGTGSGGASGDLSRLKDLCSRAGFPIPDSATDMNSVLVAFEAGIMARDGGAPENEPETDDGDADNSPSPQDSSGATTSVSPAMLSGLANLDASVRNAATAGINALAMVTQNTRTNLLERLGKVEKTAVESGHCTPKKIADLKAKLNTVSLSFMPDTGALVRRGAILELEAIEDAVRTVKRIQANNGKGKPKTKSISLGSLPTGTAPMGSVSQEELDAAIKAAADAAAARVALK